MRISALAGLAALTLCAAPAAAQSPLTARDIIERVAVRSAANIRVREGLTWRKTETVYDTSGPTERLKKIKVWDVWYARDKIWQRRISEDDIAITDPKTEEAKSDFTTKLAELFHYDLADPPLQPDPISGVECWAIRFTHDPDAEPHGDKEKVAGLLSGIMYVDPDGFWIRSASGDLEGRTYKKKFIITLGQAHQLHFELTQTEELGAIMTSYVELRYWYSAIFKGQTKERREIVLTDFRPFGPVATTSTPPQQ